MVKRLYCATCVYFNENACHRYPNQIPVNKDDWCGEHREARPAWMKDDDVVDDGRGSVISAWCPTCHKKRMQVVRPGKFQCSHCG